MIGANNPDLPPPFSPAAFRSYVRWAWLCEGGAVWLSGQTPYLRPAIMRRLREGGRPDFPPSARDAMLLGGTIFSMLEREGGPAAAVELAMSPLDDRGARSVLVDVFGRPLASVERAWRAELDSLVEPRRLTPLHRGSAQARCLPWRSALSARPIRSDGESPLCHSATPAVAAVACPADPSVARPRPIASSRAPRNLGSRGLVGVHRDHRELVAAVARHEVVGPHALPQRLSHLPQHVVARKVAVALVHLLELV